MRKKTFNAHMRLDNFYRRLDAKYKATGDWVRVDAIIVTAHSGSKDNILFDEYKNARRGL